MVFRSTSWFPPCFPTFIPSGNWISRLGSTVLRRRNFLFIFGGKCQSHYKGWNQVVFRFFLHYRLPCNYETMSSIKMVSVYYVVANHCTMQRKSRPWLNGPWRKASLLKPNSHQQNGSSANVLLISDQCQWFNGTWILHWTKNLKGFSLCIFVPKMTKILFSNSVREDDNVAIIPESGSTFSI